LLTALLVLTVLAAPAYAQDEDIVTGVEMSEEVLQQFSETDELDAATILGMLNEGLFALECASPKRMRAVVMFLTEYDAVRVEGGPAELKPGRHPAEGLLPADRMEEAWNEMAGGEVMQPDSVDVHLAPESAFGSEEEMVETMREEMEISDGRVGLIMFLTVADPDMREEMGDALQIRPMGLTLVRGE
jgi:hypothetical protein